MESDAGAHSTPSRSPGPEVTALARRFRASAEEADSRAPLYATLSASIAEDPEVAGLLAAAPSEQQLPVLLFAAVHDLLLGGAGSELAAYYPNLTEHPRRDDPYPAFRRVALDHADEIRELVATRSTQTNEVGRCALFLIGLRALIDEGLGPFSLVDVGTSAGLTLQMDRYHYRYQREEGGAVEVGTPSAVRLTCGTRGRIEVPASMPRIARRIGLDASPIDVLDDEAVRWLEACVWPDQQDRFERLRAAIALARTDPPDVRAGDAVDALSALLREVAGDGHPVVLNSWVLNYLPEHRRRDYVHTLGALGDERDLSWVLAESPRQTVGLPIPTTDPPEMLTVLSVVTWRGGQRRVRRLGTAHPHGFWLHGEG